MVEQPKRDSVLEKSWLQKIVNESGLYMCFNIDTEWVLLDTREHRK